MIGLGILAVFVLPVMIGPQNAEAHILQNCGITDSNQPSGNIKKGSDIWVAYHGTGKLVKYPQTNCSTVTTYTVGGAPLFLAVSGTTRILATDDINNKIYVFRTDTSTLERTVTLTNKPYDIYTDPSVTGTVYFAYSNTDKLGQITASTGAVTNIDLPGTTARLRGIVVDSSNVFVTDLADKKIWKYVKSSATWTSKTITEGGSYGIMEDTTNGQLYAPVYSANKLLGISTALGSYVLIDAHSSSYATDGGTPSGMFRVGNCNTDACVTYLNSGHTGAIHIQGLPAYHDADAVGNQPFNVIYDTTIAPNQIGNHVTVQASGTNAKLIRLTHFPS